ncbi:GD19214 [Drosophila simulans]|uniref:GD19214 n=1 Tax=Drosophila simulans TaxID=7240 RepID=B4QUI4_DROSI|nr:GD19214 [Drosophila simulans]
MGITETAAATTTTGLGAANAVESKQILSLEVFQDIYKHVEPDVQIDAFELAQGSDRGDNYTAALYRIKLTGKRRSLKWEQNVICKVMPESVVAREAYKSDKLFRNEVQFYNTIMPELLKFQASKTNQDTPVFNAIPKCYSARHDLLIMEDLRERGFQMSDRHKGLSLEETQSVLLQVAQLHGLSLAYKFEKPLEFSNLCSVISEGIFCTANTSWYRNYYERLTKNAIQMVSEVLPPDSKYVLAMNKFAESSSFFGRMVKLASTESPLSAICHGDCWVNNFLYHYDPEDPHRVLEVALLDFQLIRYSSIALDIANLLYCCTTKEMRDAQLQTLLKIYTEELFRWLQMLCTNLPDHCDTLQKLQDLFAES